jgi:hypothetical protein
MDKTAVRFFLDFTLEQEKWLNRMSGRGFRLVRCGKLTYDFERCAPGEHLYRVEFAADKTHSQIVEYKAFLEGLGYRIFTKNVNLNRSFGKMRLRPWAKGAGKIAASPGGFNKELLIVEKRNDGKPFELRTNAKDLAEHFRTIRNGYLSLGFLAVLIAALFAADFLFDFHFSYGFLESWRGAAAFAPVGVVSGFFTVKYAAIARRYKELAKTNE